MRFKIIIPSVLLLFFSACGQKTCDKFDYSCDYFAAYFLTGEIKKPFIYMAGHIENQVSATSSVDIFIRKMDTEAGVIWQKSFDAGLAFEDRLYSITGDKSGIYLGGTFSNDPVPASAFANWDWWILKLDHQGNTVWEKRFDGGNSFSDQIRKVLIGPDGNLYVVGFKGISPASSNTWVKRFSPAGVEDTAFEKTFPDGITNSGLDIAFDSSNNLYITSNLNSGTSNEDWMIRKFDLAGTEFVSGWNKSLDGGAGMSDFGPYVSVIDQSVFAYGSVQTVDGTFAQAVRKFDFPGNEFLSWNKTYGYATSGSQVESFRNFVFANNAYYTAGEVSADGLQTDANIKKLAQDGSVIWDKTFDSGFQKSETVSSLKIDFSGNVYITGSMLDAAGFAQPYFMKLDQSGIVLLKTTVSGINDTTWGMGNMDKGSSAGLFLLESF